MLNNPQNLSPEEYMDQYARVGDEPYVMFCVSEILNCVRYFTQYRIVWDRDGVPSLIRDYREFFRLAPAWMQG